MTLQQNNFRNCGFVENTADNVTEELFGPTTFELLEIYGNNQ